MTPLKDRVLIIDGHNLFIRCFAAVPFVNLKGFPDGGCYGFLKSLQKAINDTKCNQVVVVWDGNNGSVRKRRLNAEYKEGRKPNRFNRNIRNLTQKEEDENKLEQFIRTIEYLNLMPVMQFMLSDIEADDIIAHLCESGYMKDKIKIILSNDRDFIQLCNKETILYRPVKNEILNTKGVIEQFGIHPKNFALARSIAGDSSDNLKGVPGVGLKTVANRFSFLSESKSYLLSDIIAFCEERSKDSSLKIYQSILNHKETILMNYKIMQLYSPTMSSTSLTFIKNVLENFVPLFQQTEVTAKMMEDGYMEYNWEPLFSAFRGMSFQKQK